MNDKRRDCCNTLFSAAENGHLKCMKKLLDNDVDIESENGKGDTALVIATRHDQIECMGLLLDRNADIEKDDISGGTPLIIASRRGKIEMLRLLLDRNANIESKDNNGATALIVASGRGYFECTQLLLDRHADIESQDDHGSTALIVCANRGEVECTKLLLDRHANIEHKDNDGCTALENAMNPLRAAFSQAGKECNKVLFQKEIETKKKKLCGGHSRDFVEFHKGNLACIRLLLDANANINNVTDKYHNSECRQMISDEIINRRRRVTYDSFINLYIENQPLKNRIYSICFPDGDIRPATPFIGWNRADAARDKYYLDEILFYVHMHIANVNMRSQKKDIVSITTSHCKDHFASSSDKTYTLMKILSDRLKDYLKPKIDQCSNCYKIGTHVCSRCRITYFCSQNCQKSKWKHHKLVCKAPP